MSSAARPLPPWLTVSTGPAPMVVDGRACATRAAFFAEVARALRLPGYFGRNWDALTDALRDLGAVALVVEHAEDLLTGEPPEQFGALLAVFGDAAGSGVTLTLCTDEEHEPLLRHRVTDLTGRPA
ncbi:RNAse (barnase) inhibitor barstar [Nonomuraea fuscirosea]|uniref:RNAse (Barnase) inhibitor barstar n=1 Tax=Nonomuraea fuscirosea TaxID=1291556 RepID=A0A2T0ME77_9ACTN|nr:barstar family protein [Nonomuraea fuscirosea]PRX55847.1 RNAse (barnase) inhibitor barstar [Nonomuraea fuscirosea]